MKGGREREERERWCRCWVFYLSQPLALHFVYMLLMQLARFSLWFTPRRLSAWKAHDGRTTDGQRQRWMTNHRVLQPVKAHSRIHTWVHVSVCCALSAFCWLVFFAICLFVCLSVCLVCLFVSFLSTYLWVPARLSSFVTPILPICQGAPPFCLPHDCTFPSVLRLRSVRLSAAVHYVLAALVYATIFISSAAATSLPSVSSPSWSSSHSWSRSYIRRRRRSRSPCHSHPRTLTRTNAYCLCPGA